MKKYSAKDTMFIINEIENKIDVENWIVEDIHVWPVVRIHLAHQLNSVKTHKSKNDFQEFYPLVNKIFLIGINIIKETFNFSNTKTDVLFLTYTLYKQKKINNRWIDVYTEPIINIVKALNQNYKILEYVGKMDFKYPVHRKSDIIDLKIFFNLIKARIHENRINIKNTSDYLNQINIILQQNNLNNDLSEKFIRKKISQLIFNYKYFYYVLKKYNPKIVFTTSYYSWGIALNLACNKLNIPSIDIQHGIQGEYHPAYDKWLNVPEGGYPGLPFYFAVWSSKEKNAIESWCKESRHQAVVFGNNFIRFLPENTDSFSHYFDKSKLHVLISLQVGRGFPKIYEELISVNNNIFWWIRKHPRMTEEEVIAIKKILAESKINNYNFDVASAIDLYILLNYMQFHITEFSTVTLQALALGVPTILVDESGKDYFESEISREEAFYINKSMEIIEKINNRKFHKLSEQKSSLIQMDENIKSFIKIKLNNKI